MTKAVVILSGGMDSTTLLYKVKAMNYDEIHAISFYYNQKHQKELVMAQKTCDKLGIKQHTYDLSILGDIAPSALTRSDQQMPEGNYNDENMKATVVPNRNMVLISLAAAYAIGIKADHLYYGAHSGDHAIYPDCRPEFVDNMNKALLSADWHSVILIAPYLHNDKADILADGYKLGVDYSLTWTCYNGRDLACGECGSCRERREAFEKNGLTDPLKYEIDQVVLEDEDEPEFEDVIIEDDE